MSKPLFSKKAKSIFLSVVIGLWEHLYMIGACGGGVSDLLSMTKRVWDVFCGTFLSNQTLVLLSIRPNIPKF